MNVSTKLHAVVDRAMAPDEIALLAAFRSMNRDARNDALCIMKSLASIRPRPQPALSLVKSNRLPRPESV